MPTYRAMTDGAQREPLARMMARLYEDDPASVPPDPAHHQRTIDRLLAEPTAGTIYLFEQDGRPMGYAIVIPYWSNEIGGRLLFIDELYVSPEARGLGMARGFFGFLETRLPADCAGLILEVTPDNAGARRLYESLGFEPRKNTLMLKRARHADGPSAHRA